LNNACKYAAVIKILKYFSGGTMKKLYILIFFLLLLGTMQAQTTVSYTQQIAYKASEFSDGGGSWNANGTQVGMWAHNGNKNEVIWRKFQTADANGGSNRSLQVGDQFQFYISCTRAYGQIGFALLAGPSYGSWANRLSNYALQINNDSYGAWYAQGTSASTGSYNLYGTQGTYKNFTFTITITAPNRANITMSDGTNTSYIYDFQLNTTSAITDYAFYVADDWDGGTNQNVYFGSTSTGSSCFVKNTKALSLGASNNSFSIGNAIPNGLDAASTSTASINTLTKSGTGEVTLSAANTYTGSTTISAGTLTLSIANAISSSSTIAVSSSATLKLGATNATSSNALTLNGGTLATGATTGYSSTLGVLTLSSSSTIALGTGSHTLTFANSSSASWSGTLSITGWTGSSGFSGTAGKIFFGSSTGTLTSTQLSNISFSGYPAGAMLLSTGELVPLAYVTNAATDWNTASTWVGSSIPPAGAATIIAHNITINSAVTNAPNSITIKSGSTLTFGSSGAITATTIVDSGTVNMTSGGTLTIAASGALINYGTFTAGTGTVYIANAATINGSVTTTFNNLTLNTGVLTLTTVPHIAGVLQINNGNVSASPYYDANSTLKYNVGYNRYLEWNAVGAGTVGATAGYPYNVVINANSFNLPNGDLTDARACAGNLSINSNDTLTMGAMTAALIVGGDLTVNGTLILSTVGGGDIKTSGNVTFANTSTFTHNKRAIFFLKNGTQTVSQANGSITIPYIIIGSGSGNTILQLASTNLVTSADNGGNAISFTSGGDILDLNGKDLTIGTAGAAVTITGSGTIRGNASSRVTLLGTGALGTLNFTAGYQTLKYLSVNRTSSGTATLGTNLTINDTLIVASGDLVTGTNTITLGSSAILSETLGSMVYGNITTTRTVAQSSINKFGNIGVEITANGAAPGSTVVTRVTGTAQSGNSNTSIKRYYDITPTVNSGLNATLVFHYDNRTAELNGLSEGNLKLWKSTNSGSTWTYGGIGARDITNHIITLNGIGGFSRWTAGDSLHPLPVELNAFNSTVSGRTVSLNWTTATEINSYKFEIERSKAGADTWVTLGAVTASNYSNAPKTYNFVDKNLSAGTYNYRLKMIDNDGSFEYSKIATEATIATPTEFNLMQNYPNPFNPSTKISYSLPVDSHITLELYSITGGKVATLISGDAKAGFYDQSVDMASYGVSSGVYFYRFVGKELNTGKQFTNVKKMLFLK
jgi:autotransporter-associated beta strand protein